MPRLTIRLRLLAVFTTLFTIVFLGAVYWFYQYATQKVMEDLRQNLMVSAGTAAKMISAEEHTQIFQSGVEGDAQYEHIASQLRLVRDANPKAAAVYTAIRSDGNPSELLFVVSADEDTESRAHLREAYDASNAPEMLLAFNGPIADVKMGADEFGVWLSGYAPILDANGNSVAIVGVDMMADDVLAVQSRLRNASLLMFIVACLVIFITVFFLSDTITHPLRAIAESARMLENDEPIDHKMLETLERGSDEVSQLAHVFHKMADQVQVRQQKLKEEVARLKIEIDQTKLGKQVSEIVDSEFFQDLKSKAHNMRRNSSDNKTAKKTE
jgi:HAMP domain-containing protein